ncbi:carbohydrate-binding module family 50 protein [Polyporus arcularius HHB13444]|uniref:Carbohydrate-binding module family 50 protein n=1 Tax=Polyporus arcularius HHB13444 TaxID=1314778 RepID=A0A5C3P467_9APHY|nr:carbohydrate-binding module family 50 protein [Polyporus arcularius HHB13444]
MGRWTQYDEDSYRLPEGMKRVGYDADTGKYYYRDGGGSLWEGAEGAQYGELKRVSHAPIPTGGAQEDPSDEEAEIGGRADGYRPLAVDDGSVRHTGTSRSDSAYRMILPFFLIIAVILLLVFRLVHSATPSNPPECPGSSEVYHVSRGDTCWELAQARGCSVDDILTVNRDLRCESLRPGEAICLPPKA